MPEPSLRHLTFTIPASLAGLEPMEAAAEALAREAGFNPDDTGHLTMVLREAAINGVIHGNRRNPAKLVTVALELTADRLVMAVRDQGAGMDPDQLPDPFAHENLLKTSGRGVLLMRSLMDEVQFTRLVDGMLVRMTKLRPQAAPAQIPQSTP